MKKVVLEIDTDHLTTAEVRTAFLGQISVATRWGRNQYDKHGWCIQERTLDIVDARVMEDKR